MYPGDFTNDIEMKSLDTIVKEYQSNAFFKVKIDLMLRKMDEEEEVQSASYSTHTSEVPQNNENQKPTNTLKN